MNVNCGESRRDNDSIVTRVFRFKTGTCQILEFLEGSKFKKSFRERAFEFFCQLLYKNIFNVTLKILFLLILVGV